MSDPTNPAIGLCFLIAGVIGVGSVCAGFASKAGTQDPTHIHPGKVETWYYRPLDLIGPAATFLIFVGLFGLTLATPDASYADLNAFVLVFNMGLQGVIAGGAVLIALQRTSLNTWLGLRWQHWPWLLLIAPACVLLMMIVFWGIEATGYLEWMESLGAETMQETVKMFQESNDFVLISLLAFTAVFVAPICEEIVFRGLFYPVMKKFSGPWVAAFCSGLIFAAAHGNLTVLLPLFILGILLVFVYEKTGSIWAPIAVHFCFNTVTVSIQLLMRIYKKLPITDFSP